MRKAIDVYQEAPGSRRATKPTLDAAWIAALFSRLRGRYTRLWTLQFPTEELYDEAKREWARVLAGMEGPDIERGLATWKGEYPPNAYSFKEACQRKSAAHRAFVALPRPKADPGIAAGSIAKMKDELNRNEGKDR